MLPWMVLTAGKQYPDLPTVSNDRWMAPSGQQMDGPKWMDTKCMAVAGYYKKFSMPRSIALNLFQQRLHFLHAADV